MEKLSDLKLVMTGQMMILAATQIALVLIQPLVVLGETVHPHQPVSRSAEMDWFISQRSAMMVI